MIVLGLHGGVTLGQHDASACVMIDGRIAALCEDERYSRQKGSYGALPVRSIHAALKVAGIVWEDVRLVVVPGITYDDASARWQHHLQHHFGSVPRIERTHHQLAHCATAFYGSGYKEAHILSLDASGDACAGAWGWVDNGKLAPHHLTWPQTKTSIGYFYTLMTQYCGFDEGDEYKLMGLAPYGKPRIDLSEIIRPSAHGWKFDWGYVRDDPACRSPFEPLYSNKVCALLGQPARRPTEPISEFYKDVAASVQAAFTDCLLSLAVKMKAERPKITNLVYAGGCALNAAANRALRAVFPGLYVPPVAGDRGLSLGCAYLGAVGEGDTPQPITSAYLGQEYTDAEIDNELRANDIIYGEWDIEGAAACINNGSIIGWFQGRSEAGARALGHRSILANAHDAKMKDKLNARIKFREDFRPFAPAVLEAHAAEYFEMPAQPLPYMTENVCVTNGSIPAVTHIDRTARVQTVNGASGLFAQLLERVEGGIVLNTSANLRGEPIIESPRDAIRLFYSCGLDAMFIGPFVLTK